MTQHVPGAQGRLTSTDPLLASARPSAPQTWNRYSYASNNPLRYTDPSGMLENDENEVEQPQQATQRPAPDCKLPQGITVTVGEPTIGANIPFADGADGYFTGPLSIFSIIVNDKDGNAIKDGISITESVVRKDTKGKVLVQNPREMAPGDDGVTPDYVGIGLNPMQPVKAGEARDIVQSCAVWGQVAFFNEGLWAKAERVFQLALDVQERLYDSSSAGMAKQDALVGVSSVKHNVVLHQAYVKARLGKVRAAVELLEKWRGRQIAERLEMSDFSLAGVADEDRESFLEVTRRISELRAAERDDVPDDLIQLIGAHQQARDERARLIEKIRSYKPDFLCGLTYEDIRRAASDAEPLAFILATKRGTLTILVAAGAPLRSD